MNKLKVSSLKYKKAQPNFTFPLFLSTFSLSERGEVFHG